MRRSVVTVVDLGPTPTQVIEAIAMVADVGPRRAAELVEWLPASVTLLDAGPDRMRVTKLIRAATGLQLREAKQLVDAAPAVIVSRLSADAAATLRRELEAAGAQVGA